MLGQQRRGLMTHAAFRARASVSREREEPTISGDSINVPNGFLRSLTESRSFSLDEILVRFFPPSDDCNE